MEQVCLLCFNPTGNNRCVPAAESDRIFANCLTFLHTAIANKCTKDGAKDGKNQLPFCKKCFDAAVHLTQLNTQLTAFQKEISDLIVEFSMAVACRRNQVAEEKKKNTSSLCKQIVEFDVTGLPPELFAVQKPKLPQPNPLDDEDDNDIEDDEDTNNFTAEDDLVVLDPTCDADDNDDNDDNEDSLYMDFYDEAEDLDNTPLADRCASKERADPLSEDEVETITLENSRKKLGRIEVSESNLLRSTRTPKPTPKVALALTPEKAPVEEVKKRLVATKKTGRKQIHFRREISEVEEEEDDDDNEMPELRPEGSKPRHRTAFDQIRPDDILTDKSKSPTAALQKTLDLMRKVVRTKSKLRKNTGKFKCEICNNYFTSSNYLIVHKRIHTGEKPYKCNVCGRKFIQGAHLRGHIKTHTGEKPFKCIYCVKTFVSDVHRRRHQLIHTGEKPYKCSFCNKSFNTAGNKTRHQATHTKKPLVKRRGRKKKVTTKKA